MFTEMLGNASYIYIYIYSCSEMAILAYKVFLCYNVAKHWIQSFYQLVFFQLAKDLYFILEILNLGLIDLSKFLIEYC